MKGKVLIAGAGLGGLAVAALCTTTRYGPCEASSSTTCGFDTSPRTSTTSAPAARTLSAACSAAASFRM